MRVASDDELVQFSACGPANERVVFKHIDRLNYFANARVTVADVVFGKMTQNAVKIVRDLDRQLNLCHHLA